MLHHSHSKKSDYTHLLESINALTKFITDFTDSEKRHHDSFLATFHLLQNQIQEQIPTTTPIPSTETMKPPSLTLQLSNGSNHMKPKPDSQQLTAQGGDVSRVDGLASFSPIAITDSPSEGPHLSVVHLRPTLPRTPNDQDPLHKLAVTASSDSDSHPVLLQNPSDQMLHTVGTKIQAAGGAVMPPPPPEPPDAKPQGDDHVSLPAKSTNAGIFEDASIPDTGPYDSGPFNSPTPATEVTLHRYAPQGIISGSGSTVTDRDTVSLGTGLIDILCLRGQVDSARNLFDKMHKKDVASCKSIHSYGVKRHNCGVGPNSLPAMFSKCGKEYLAHRIFDRTRVYAVIGKEIKKQALDKWERKLDVLIACVSGGSNAMGLFNEFVGDKDVRLINLVTGQISCLKEIVDHLSVATYYSMPRSLVLSYDKVTIDGKLNWQDQLAKYNKPIFDICHGTFEDYTWKSNYPRLYAASAVAGDCKFDMYMGIDIFGRVAYGGGKWHANVGLDVLRKNEISTAILKPGGVYETRQFFVLDCIDYSVNLRKQACLDSELNMWSLGFQPAVVGTPSEDDNCFSAVMHTTVQGHLIYFSNIKGALYFKQWDPGGSSLLAVEGNLNWRSLG